MLFSDFVPLLDVSIFDFPNIFNETRNYLTTCNSKCIVTLAHCLRHQTAALRGQSVKF